MPQLITIHSAKRTSAPAWALLERQLFQAMEEAGPLFLAKYTRENGDLILQAGYYGEHLFTTVQYEESPRTPAREVSLLASYDGKYPPDQVEYSQGIKKVETPVHRHLLAVHLQPGSEIRLHIGLQRYARRPSYALPWD